MENAAKALTIAGAVLISIIVISTLLYSFQQWGLFPKAQDENKEIDQLVEFNREFESYNKKNLYGADVLTVLNKAIDNNDKYDITNDPNDPYYVEVEIQLTSEVYGYKIKYIYGFNDKGEVIKDKPPEKIEDDTPSLYVGTYKLSENLEDLNKLRTITKPTKVSEKRRGHTLERIEEFFAETDFRLNYFTCTEMSKDELNGRIDYIRFEEVDINKLVDQDNNPIHDEGM